MEMVSGDYTDAVGQRLAAWYSEKTGINFYTVYTATGYLVDGRIKAVALYTDYTGANIELHLVANGVLNRQVIITALQYVFGQLGCIRLTVKLQRKDKKISKMLLRGGFDYECTLKSYYGLQPENDALVYRMLKPQADRWIR